ncbi:putative inorganic phosphate cotransporter, partial [Armadillidium nasatum]
NGDFTWDEFTQSLVLGSFFWGYIWLQVPGKQFKVLLDLVLNVTKILNSFPSPSPLLIIVGRLAEVIGPRRVYGCAILGSAILALFIPVASHSSPIAVMVVRFLMGVQAGTILAFLMSASIINSFGWEFVFYIQASITIIWAIAWFVLVTDKPEDFRWISESEKEYMKKTISPTKNEKSPPLPWKSILTSVPFLAIIIADLGNNWGFFTLVTDLPLYMKNMLRTNISNNAQFSGIPYLGMWIFSFLISIVADFLTRRRILNVTWVRKLATLIAHGGQGICLLCLSFVECNRSWTVTLLFISITLQGGVYAGWQINHIDIAPNFAGTLFGITNALASIPAWIAPIVVGTLTNKNHNYDR